MALQRTKTTKPIQTARAAVMTRNEMYEHWVALTGCAETVLEEVVERIPDLLFDENKSEQVDELNDLASMARYAGQLLEMAVDYCVAEKRKTQEARS